ncbi:SafA/ExsA family spore coat assembly protein [Psychrobacillus sp. INOP01]|uniref:SafA/ExsA family spore coat assembly protein n=1 Tax=Psychrobacillus sp. INOP01 TaxID=2829187 RepID=UPI001BACC37E|nr:SafA/ExsA family spore coat assembly protein [Psychrobacillus sp. INOP01]QUG42217.1 SafA/ExsA family spore coat assembly protein [Psychrobacillus sp. INOP01]
MQTHIVVKGDTLWKISRNYGVSFEELKKVNAHLANPEYIVPGMKIFIPNSKKMESTTHPYSDNRPVKKEMVKKEMMKKEEVKISDKTKMQQVPPVVPVVPMPQPMQPVAPTYQQPQQPKAQPPKQQQKPQTQPSYTFPIQMMPVPDIDMTPSPQGWRLMESTSIHIHNHIENYDINVDKTPAPQPTPPPVQPIPIQPTPQLTSPISEEASPMFEASPTFPTMYPCPPFQQFPYMHHQADYGGFPCVQICYVPVYPCPPYPYHHY